MWKLALADYHGDMRYDVVFRGKLASGFAEEAVRNNLAKLFKIDPRRAEALLSGKKVVLKRDLDKDKAEKYRTVLRKAGAIVAVVQQRDPEPLQTRPAPKPAPSPSASANRASFQIDDPESGTAEPAGGRASYKIDESPPEETEDAAASAENESEAADDGGLDYPGLAATGEAAEAAKPAVQTEPVTIPAGEAADDYAPDEAPGLEEPGAQIVSEVPVPEPEIDTSNLTMSEVGVTVDESARPERREIDTSHLTAEDFESLDDGTRPAPPEIDTSSLSVADPGTTVDDSPRPPPKQIDTSSLSATDIDEPLDRQKKPAAPDIDLSGLGLEDD